MTAKEMAAIVAAVQAAMSPEPEPKVAPKGRKTTRKAAPKVAASCITAGIAWNLLGADPAFEPKDPDKPATNAQLWRLNTAGRLTVS